MEEITKKLAELKEIVAQVEEDTNKFVDKGIKAAAKRARVGCSNAKMGFQELRRLLVPKGTEE